MSSNVNANFIRAQTPLSRELFSFSGIAKSKNTNGSPMIPQSILSKLHFQASLMPKFLAAAVVLSLGLSAHASNIVTDGGFESAGGSAHQYVGNMYNQYYAGETIDGGSWNVVSGSVFIDSGDPYVYSGNNSLNLTGVNPYTADAVSQTLTTAAGGSYVLNFWANSDSDNAFSILINGVALAGIPASIVDNGFPNQTTNNTSLFQDYSESFLATSNSTTVTFSDVANPPEFNPNGIGSVMIDNVSVQLTPTPEPASIVLLFTGILALGLLVARKRLNHSVIAS
jgi:hypothetical protein